MKKAVLLLYEIVIASCGGANDGTQIRISNFENKLLTSTGILGDTSVDGFNGSVEPTLNCGAVATRTPIP